MTRARRPMEHAHLAELVARCAQAKSQAAALLARAHAVVAVSCDAGQTALSTMGGGKGL